MTILCGPILHLEQGTRDLWKFSVHVLTDLPADAPQGSIRLGADLADATVGGATLVAAFPEVGRTVWCCPVAVPRTATQRLLTYTLRTADENYQIDRVAIPARDRLPAMAFFSCNGFSSEELWRKTGDPNGLWRRLWEEHARGCEGAQPDRPSAIHVLLGGGDQVYADSLPVLQELDRLSDRDLGRLRESTERRRTALKQYLDLYAERWTQTEVFALLARVPGVFTWDDHDILDGWGSHRSAIQDSPAYRDVFAAAREAFCAMQLGGGRGGRRPPLLAPTGDRPEGHFLQAVTLHATDQELELVLLDLRNDRTGDRVLSDAQWDGLKTVLARAEAAPAGPGRHLLVISAVPVVYLRFKAVSWILRNVVPGVQEVEDDLLDQWEHPAHLGERARLLMGLLRHQAAAQRRVTLLSGDVHAGALGRIESSRPEHRAATGIEPARIHQLTSSGIVHPSPNGWQRWFLELLGAEGCNEVTSGVTTDMLPLDSRTERLWSRNFLLLDVEPASAGGAHQLWARYVAEDWPLTRMITIPPWS